MDIVKPVIVTALFDIDRPNWKNYKSSYHTYIQWSRNLLSIDCPLVIFTEEKFFKDLFDIRKEYDPKMSQTKSIVNDKESLMLYHSHYKKIKELMESEPFANRVQFPDVPEMCQPWYNIIMMSKLNLMKETYVHQYIPNDLVIWKDIAVYRDKPERYENVKWPDVDKINRTKPTFFSHHEKVSIHDNKSHILSQMRFVQGGSFAIPGYLLQPVEKAYMNLVDNYLSLGYVGSDEKYLDLLVKENPDKFELIKCDWREYFPFFEYEVAQ